MSLFGMFQISGSALAAERLRAEVATSNVAATDLTNAEEARSATVQAAATVNGLSLMDYLSAINAS